MLVFLFAAVHQKPCFGLEHAIDSFSTGWRSVEASFVFNLQVFVSGAVKASPSYTSFCVRDGQSQLLLTTSILVFVFETVSPSFPLLLLVLVFGAVSQSFPLLY